MEESAAVFERSGEDDEGDSSLPLVVLRMKGNLLLKLKPEGAMMPGEDR